MHSPTQLLVVAHGAKSAAGAATTAHLIEAVAAARPAMADDLRVEFAARPAPVEVATYLLADGQFVTTLRGAADGLATVADPIGVHPALVELLWTRYEEAVA